jgi:Ca2+/H+ antiporter
MTLAVIAILLPTMVIYTSNGVEPAAIQNLSLITAIVLIAVYALTLLFSLKTHSYLYEVGLLELESENPQNSQRGIYYAQTEFVAVDRGASCLNCCRCF